MDRLDGRILVKGWALDLLAPSGKATVRIRIGDHEFWTLADAALQDAPVSTLADGRFGFRFSLEAKGEAIPSVHFVDGSPLPRIASLPMGIATTPIRWPLSTSEQTGLTASLEFHNDIVRGWVREASSGLPVDIAVRVDGEIVWSGLATRLESSALDGSGSRTPHGFRLLLPRPLRPTMMRAIDIRAADGRVIPNGRFSVIDGATFRGSVEAAVPAKDGVTVRGWCLDLQRPLHPLRLNAVDAEGRVVGATVAQGDRPDLRSALQIDTPYGGFTLTLPPSGVVWPVQIIGEGSFRAVPPGAVVPQEAVDDATGAPVFATADDLVEGRVDKIWAHGIRGWAREKTGRAQVFVDLLMDGIWVATVAARSFRPDLARHFGDHGCHEFRFELTSSQAWQAPGQIVVRPRRAIGAIVAAKNIRLEGPLAPAKRHCLRHFANERRLLVTKPVTLNKVKAQQFAVIILNRDGAGLLDRLFQSFKDHSSYQKLEFIVVDHGSKDDSREVCHRWATEFEVNFFDRGGNHSFSNSNNYGVAKSAGDYVLFLNNDVRLSEDVLGSLARHLSCPEVGVVGIGLEDDVPAPGLEDPEGHRPIQHLGVHVALAPGPYAIHAFESRYSSEWEGLDRAAMRSPAVTGAVMAMRREVFEDLGGFDERYYYGYEDVDLCLRARQKGLDIVCLNGKRALHLRAYSRSQVGANYDDSQRRNRVLLDARFGSSLRRALGSGPTNLLAAQRFR
jgi:GT2 family glycosyltransferase